MIFLHTKQEKKKKEEKKWKSWTEFQPRLWVVYWTVVRRSHRTEAYKRLRKFKNELERKIHRRFLYGVRSWFRASLSGKDLSI